jgi:hypothetical protein
VKRHPDLLPNTRTFRELMTTDFSQENDEPQWGEPGDPVYDAWLEKHIRAMWRRRVKRMSPEELAKVELPKAARATTRRPPTDPADFQVDFSREYVPKWVVRRVLQARKALAPTNQQPPVRRSTARAPRPRQRRTRTSSPTRGSPDDDPDAHFAWFERTGQVDRYYESVDPRTYAPFVVRLDDGNIVSENPPSWFLKKLNRERPPLRTPQPVPSPMVPPRRRRRR